MVYRLHLIQFFPGISAWTFAIPHYLSDGTLVLHPVAMLLLSLI